MSEKVKNGLDKINKILGILCAVMLLVTALRITNYHIDKLDNYTDNSITEQSIIKITPNNNIEKTE